MRLDSGHKFTAAVLICSDRAFQGVRPDETAPRLKARLLESGYAVEAIEIVPDDRAYISKKLKEWIGDGIHLILTSGGTGLAPSDVTPDTTLEIIERRVPGMEEAMRSASMKITPRAMFSRGVVGVTSESLIVNLPGNPNGAIENFDVIQPQLWHALELITGGKPDK